MAVSSPRRTTFAGDVLKVASGATFAQAVNIVVAPALTRLFAPAAFGLAAPFLAIMGVLRVISCLRYELSIVIARTEEEASNLLALSVGLAGITSLITLAVVWIGRSAIADWLRTPELAPFLWLLPPIVLANGLVLSFTYWNSRAKNFGRISVANGANSLAAAAAKLMSGLSGNVSGGSLIAGTTIGAATAATYLTGTALRDQGDRLRTEVTATGISAGLRRYYKFPAFSSWSALLNALSWQLPVLLLARFFPGGEIVGYYSLANRMVRMPMMLLGTAMSQVFFQRAAGAETPDELQAVSANVFERLVTYGLFPMLLLAVTGEMLFEVVFGARWTTAGTFAQILSIYMFFNFLCAPMGQLVSVLERQEAALVINVLLVVTRVGAIWYGSRVDDPIAAMVLLSVSGVLVYGAYSMWIARASAIALAAWSVAMARTAALSGAMLAGAWYLCHAFGIESWAAVVVYAAAALVYYAFQISRDELAIQSTRRMLAAVRLTGGTK